MSTILQLSYNTASQKSLTSDWTNTFQQQVILNPGDSLITKLCLLDYSSTGAYTNIEIPQDTNVSMTCGFYYNLTDNTKFNPAITPPPNKDDFDGLELYKYHVARDDNNNLITSTKNFTIKKGVYDINELCEQITRTLTTINTDDIGRSIYFDNKPNEFFYRSTQANEYSANVYNFTNIKVGQTTWHILGIVKDTNLWELQPFTQGQEVTMTWEYDVRLNTISGTLIELDKNAGTFTISYQENNYGFDEIELGDPPYPYFYGIMYNKTTTAIKFYDPENFDPTLYFTLNTRSYMGASQCALVFDDNNDGKFSFKYLHTPLYSQNLDESVALLGVAGSSYYYVCAQSGIFFTDLQPKELWQDIMGFNLSDFLMSDNTATHNLNQNFKLGKNITSNLITYDNVFDKTHFTNSPALNTPLYTTSSDTTKILGLLQQTNYVSPYFIVQILGLGNVNLLDDDKSYQTIAQICSKEYDNNGVITSFSDSIPFYYNNGPDPLLISSLRVRILDGTTKKPTLILGENNNIFIQIIKNTNN